MPKLIPTNSFLKDMESFRHQESLRKKIAKALHFLETNPTRPSLHLERIANAPSAWSCRIDREFRIAVDPSAFFPGGNPDWAADVILLRILSHDDLYRHPR